MTAGETLAVVVAGAANRRSPIYRAKTLGKTFAPADVVIFRS
jgi:hypothetical protein